MALGVVECGVEKQPGVSDVCEEAIKLYSAPFASLPSTDTQITDDHCDAARLLRMWPLGKSTIPQFGSKKADRIL